MDAKFCKDCKNYNAYYTKGYCNFIKENCGYCRKMQSTVESRSGCMKWENKSVRQKTDLKLVVYSLGEALTSIESIREYLESYAEK